MKNRFLLLSFLVLGPFWVVHPVHGEGKSPKGTAWEEIFYEANQNYREGDYRKAAQGYLKLIEMGHDDPRIQYNLGNAWFKQNQLGRAILAYERALIAMPRDADLNDNLDHVQDQVMDAIPPSRGFFNMAFFWLPSISLSELFGCFAVLNLLLWTFLIIRLFHQSEWLFYLLLLVSSLWLVSGISLGIKWFQTFDDSRAVILAKEVSVLAGPHEGDTVLFKLHEGAVVEQERSEGSWRLIRLPDKKRGWLPEEALELIYLNSSQVVERKGHKGSSMISAPINLFAAADYSYLICSTHP